MRICTDAFADTPSPRSHALTRYWWPGTIGTKSDQSLALAYEVVALMEMPLPPPRPGVGRADAGGRYTWRC